MADYKRLKWADDKRWTNLRKRGTYKALAEASHQTNDAEWLANDEATAGRVADVKRSTAALYQALGARDNVVGHLLPDAPFAGRAAYFRMESAAVAERSLREKLVRDQHQLDECRHRVANKTARLAQLKARVAVAKKSVPTKPSRRPPVLESALMLDKKVDALKLGNLQAAKARDIIANNTAMRDALNEQLASDVRQQATAVVELLAYGMAAKQEAVAYIREYCRVAGEHESSVRRKKAYKRMLDTRISVLESNRCRCRFTLFFCFWHLTRFSRRNISIHLSTEYSYIPTCIEVRFRCGAIGGIVVYHTCKILNAQYSTDMYRYSPISSLKILNVLGR